MKVSQWLRENVNSHAIFDHKLIVGSFKKETKQDPCWPIHTVGHTNSTLGTFKGLEQEIKGNESDHVAYGWEIAEALADKLIGYQSPCNGRGSRFDTCIEALEKAGK